MEQLNPTSYIANHLHFNEHAIRAGSSFWVIHTDTLVMSVLLGLVVMGLVAWVVRGATAGVPNKRQALVELIFEFVDGQVRNIFHGDRHRFIAPLAFTVFLWVFAMNAMDFLPVDIMHTFYGWLSLHHWRSVPTSDINTTFALALSVWLLMIFYAIRIKGMGGWMHELFCTPFGTAVWVWPANFLFNLIEYVSKPLSHSLRLFGNMYAGEVIFLLLGLWASTGLSGTLFSALLGAGWSIFHILIVALQAFIFMMLTVVYLAMAHESH